MSKLRSDSTLALLTEEQRNQLYDWIVMHSFAGAQTRAAKPVDEDGFNLKIHRTTLVRFFEAEQSERQTRELTELAAEANNGDVPQQIEALIQATRQKFIRATYELAKAAAEPQSYDRVENALHHMDLIKARREELELKKRELDQEDKRMEEQRRQWEYNAARAALNHMPELQKIYNDQTIDPEDKIWAARDVCFGKDPSTETGTAGVTPASESMSSEASAVNQPENLQPSSFNRAPCDGGATHYDMLKHDNSTSALPVSAQVTPKGGSK
jgi:hypothetical protein